MKKKLIVVILIIVLITMLVPSLFAADRSSNLPSIEGAKSVILSKSSVDEEMTGILPTSRFYFLKELGRGVRRILTVNPVYRAEYEIQVAREKMAELRKLKELDLENYSAIKDKIQDVQNEVDNMVIKLPKEFRTE